MRKIILSFLLVLLTVSLTSCSNNKEENLMQTIKQKKQIVVATEATFPPFEYVENDKIVGYNPELAKLVFDGLNVEVKHVDTLFSGIFTGLKEKKFDAVITALSVTQERKENKDFKFTSPIAENKFLVVVTKDNDTITNMDDLKGKTAGVNLNSAPHKNVEKYNEELKAKNEDAIIVKTYSSTPDALIDLENNRIDFAVVPSSVIYNIIDKNPDKYQIACQFSDVQVYMCWAVRTDDKELLEFINKRLLELKKDGTMEKLQEKYFKTTFELPDTVY